MNLQNKILTSSSRRGAHQGRIPSSLTTGDIGNLGARLADLQRRLERFDGEFESTQPLVDELLDIRATLASLEFGIDHGAALRIMRGACASREVA
ncbi:hypothetical protein GHU20_13470 [Pseudomonas aeruginosa]|nr:hypothetical protein [Pseudomonas aeruginosa]